MLASQQHLCLWVVAENKPSLVKIYIITVAQHAFLPCYSQILNKQLHMCWEACRNDKLQLREGPVRQRNDGEVWDSVYLASDVSLAMAWYKSPRRLRDCRRNPKFQTEVCKLQHQQSSYLSDELLWLLISIYQLACCVRNLWLESVWILWGLEHMGWCLTYWLHSTWQTSLPWRRHHQHLKPNMQSDWKFWRNNQKQSREWIISNVAGACTYVWKWGRACSPLWRTAPQLRQQG